MQQGQLKKKADDKCIFRKEISEHGTGLSIMHNKNGYETGLILDKFDVRSGNLDEQREMIYEHDISVLNSFSSSTDHNSSDDGWEVVS